MEESKRKLQDAQLAQNDLQQKIASAVEDATKDMQGTIESLKRNAESMEKRCTEEKTRADACDSRCKDLEREKQDLTEKIEIVDRERDAHKARLEVLEEIIDDFQMRLSTAMAEQDQFQREHCNDEETLRVEFQLLNNELSRLSTIEDRSREQELRIGQLLNQLENSHIQHDRLLDENIELSRKLDAMIQQVKSNHVGQRGNCQRFISAPGLSPRRRYSCPVVVYMRTTDQTIDQNSASGNQESTELSTQAPESFARPTCAVCWTVLTCEHCDIQCGAGATTFGGTTDSGERNGLTPFPECITKREFWPTEQPPLLSRVRSESNDTNSSAELPIAEGDIPLQTLGRRNAA